MAANVLSLPVDIPWKRLCVSEDMIDRKVGDHRFPYRWRSSVAVFSYQPPEDQQAYEGMIVSYLKVACTITSFQPNPDEVGIKDRRVDSYWNTSDPINNYKNIVSKAYGCYGAILEVGVAPSESSGEVDLSKYPYFIDFDPKKREVYETVSETGENMSRSLEELSVSKGTTTSNAHEVLDETTKGVKVSAGGGIGFVSGSVEGSFQNRSSTRDLGQQEVSNVRTRDSAREVRENFSHTTQLTQLYHQLNSYHLGTNRAVFFMLPRPHIVPPENDTYTFVNGVQKLEGVQEFFLVVMRPKEVESICVEAYLETAHIADLPVYEDRYKTDTETSPHLSILVEAPIENRPGSYDSVTRNVTYLVRPGWEIDIGNSGGYRVNISPGSVGVNFCTVTEIDTNHLVLTGKVHAQVVEIKDLDPGVDRDNPGEGPVLKPTETTTYEPIDGRLEANATVFIRQKERVATGQVTSSLYITGRGVYCCDAATEAKKLASQETVVWEGPFNGLVNQSMENFARLSLTNSNQLLANIGQTLVQSINHPDRYAPGTVSFVESQIMAQSMANLIEAQEHPDNHPLENITGLNSEIREKIARRTPDVSRSDLLLMSPAEQRDRFGLRPNEVRQLRRAVMGLEGSLPEPQDRWNSPGQTKTEQRVPNLIGLTLEESRRELKAIQLSIGDVSYQDSELPHDVVLAQEPSADTTVLSGTVVNLIVSTGATIRIPDVVGKLLSQALIMLRDAGLQSEPEICFTSSEEYPRNQVLNVSPEMRSYITPHACVTLQVSSRASNCETSSQGTV